jgi:hypothetical protein
MEKEEWIEDNMKRLHQIQLMDGIGGSMMFAELSEEFYELFGEELLDELKEKYNQ